MEIKEYTDVEKNGLTQLSQVYFSLTNRIKDYQELYNVTKETPKTYTLESLKGYKCVIRKSEIGHEKYGHAFVLPIHVSECIERYHVYKVEWYKNQIENLQKYLLHHQTIVRSFHNEI